MRTTDIKFLAKASEGTLTGCDTLMISGVKIDSRACGEGDLFICIEGAKSDGHSYIRSAYDNGCRAFLVTKDVEELEGAAYIRVPDSYAAAVKMAKAYLDQFELIKIGVTGSVGKTTTRMLVAAVMAAKYRTVST